MGDRIRAPMAQFTSTGVPEPTGTASSASVGAAPSGPNAPLTEVIQAWPRLSEPIQSAITAIIHAALGVRTS
jgi:hypothetical protein